MPTSLLDLLHSLVRQGSAWCCLRKLFLITQLLQFLSKGGAIKLLLDLLHHVQANELLDSCCFLKMQRIIMADLDLSHYFHYFIRTFVYSSFPKIVSQVVLVLDDFLVALLKLVEVKKMPLILDKLCELIAYLLNNLKHLGVVSF